MCTTEQILEARFSDLSELGRSKAILRAVQAVHRDARQLKEMMGIIMPQLDDLISTLNAISTDVDTSLSQVSQLTSQLESINASTPPEVDLQPAIDLANSIRSRLENTSASASSATTTGASDSSSASADTSGASDGMIGVAGQADGAAAGDSSNPTAPDPSSAAGVSDGGSSSGSSDGGDTLQNDAPVGPSE